MTRDDARLAEIYRLSDAARALSEAQDAAEIGGWDDSHVPSLADWLGAAAIVTCIFGLGVVGHAALKMAGVM
jgi:hypothetical protein